MVELFTVVGEASTSGEQLALLICRRTNIAQPRLTTTAPDAFASLRQVDKHDVILGCEACYTGAGSYGAWDLHVLELDRFPADTLFRRGDPRGELAGRRHLLHEFLDKYLVVLDRKV